MAVSASVAKIICMSESSVAGVGVGAGGGLEGSCQVDEVVIPPRRSSRRVAWVMSLGCRPFLLLCLRQASI
jgi:hypothetical protein